MLKNFSDEFNCQCGSQGRGGEKRAVAEHKAPMIMKTFCSQAIALHICNKALNSIFSDAVLGKFHKNSFQDRASGV